MVLSRVVATVLTVMCALAPAMAQADGDPASDTLVEEDVFFPYTPPVSKPYGPALVDLLKRVRADGYPMKVALIQSASDLGSYPQLFNNMQEYANLLNSELPTPTTAQHGVKAKEQTRLLVVMPAGFGGVNLGDGVDAALAPVKIDTEAESDGLTRAALEAVARIASANGHETPVPPEATAEPIKDGDDEGGAVSPLVFIAPLALVLVGAGLAGRLARRKSEEVEGELPTGEEAPSPEGASEEAGETPSSTEGPEEDPPAPASSSGP